METKKEEVTPLTGILCLKTRQDMKRIEETDDCFILDFDPFDSFDVKNISFSGDREADRDLLLSMRQARFKYRVACRDYPHPRHLCLNYPFGSTPSATHCHLVLTSVLFSLKGQHEYVQCYSCCVCNKPAPCAQWISSHCNASADSMERRTMD
ncbi:hypothetical protein Bca4012_010873 [Brassica carinata]|uniref:Uncharacterized protein n=1 Tax=Brassica carinata TaxID=52824 RepID=A0A8X7S2P7_BRACI|nr:hypothetical protein Bca52824_035771 [Brassica carinata]